MIILLSVPKLSSVEFWEIGQRVNRTNIGGVSGLCAQFVNYRRTSRDADVGSVATPGMLSESEASELFGDYIDEDSQTVQHVSLPDCNKMTKHKSAISSSRLMLLFVAALCLLQTLTQQKLRKFYSSYLPTELLCLHHTPKVQTGLS